MKKGLISIALVCMIALLSWIGDSAVTAQSSTTVDVHLLSTLGQIDQDDTFTVLVSLDPSHLVEINAFQVYLDFDPAVLQLVPASASNNVEPGAPFGANRFQDVLQDSVDNTAGTVDFAGGAGPNGLDTVGPFVVAAIKFEAIGSSANTVISFGTIDPRQTKVVSGTTVVTGTLNGLSFPVGGNTPLSDFFRTVP